MYIERFLHSISQSYFLFGPRGTGKSTWLKHYYPNALTIDLLKPNHLRNYQSKPERLYELLEGIHNKTIIIDEIQKIPELLTVVHSLIEEKRGLQFILTGSSARKLKRAGVDLLAGRALLKHLHPFMAAELKQDFSLKNALQYGLVPLVVESETIAETLDAYINLYLNEEVKAEGLVRNIGDFSRFLEVISFSHGSILNLSNIARECQVSRKLIEGYVDILQDLLLCSLLPVFTKRAKRKIVAHPKFYYFDTGVYKSLRLTSFIDNDQEINGPGLEGLIFQHLRAWNDYIGTPYRLYYWRTQTGMEVDFIIHGKYGLFAVEVKNSTIIHPQDLKGIKSFLLDYPEATAIFLYRGSEKLKMNNIWCLPVEDFLISLTPDRQVLIEQAPN